MIGRIEVKKRDEAKRMEVEHLRNVSRLIKSADGGTGVSHNNCQANGVARRRPDSEKGRRRCEAVSQM